MNTVALYLVIICTFCCLMIEKVVCEENLQVSVQNGKILGSQLTSAKGRKFYAFRGIPFAKPPVEDLRFKLPVPAEPWDGVFNATVEGPICPQQEFNITSGMTPSQKYIGQEDCLYLNVYTPMLPSENNVTQLPVMVFIHGGGYLFGSGNWVWVNPAQLLDKDIVFVTMNYRLGPFGFLSMHDEELPGNYGLFDQIIALKWVQENIRNFGGDPTKVTISGESAGASSVSHLVLSPKAEGLFHGAIMESGTSFCGWSIGREQKKWSKIFTLKLGCPVFNSKAITDCMKNKTATDFLKALETMGVACAFPLIFLPVVEKTPDGFFPEEPCEIIKSGKFNKVPLIIGMNEKEGAMTYIGMEMQFNQSSEEHLNEDLNWLLPIYGTFRDDVTTTVNKIRNQYFGNPLITDNGLIKQKLINMYSELMFDSCTDSAQKLFSEAGVPVYTYKFTHRGNFSITKIFGNQEDLGVTHADELQYLYGDPFHQYQLKDNDLGMSEIMLSLWTNFVKTSDPTPDDRLSFKWKPVKPNESSYLDLNLNSSMINDKLTHTTDFWKGIYENICS